MKKYSFLLCAVLGCFFAAAQSDNSKQIRQFRQSREHVILDEYFSFLSIPNIAKDSLNILKNASFITEMMKKRNIQNVQLLYPATTGAPPSVYGEYKVAKAKGTIIFYAHYDGQPVNPAQWAEGLSPFKPQLTDKPLDRGGLFINLPEISGKINPEWRIYARGASDDKAGVMAVLNAFDGIQKSGMSLAYNIKFFFEGEEEAGSPHLHEILTRHKELLQGDIWIICDGPVHQSGKKQVVFGVRGDTHLDLTVYASKRPLHSGHYGNWAPNPALMLAKLLSSMKDENGRVTIKGFYDDVVPLTASELKALKQVPSVDDQMKKELGLAATEMKGSVLAEAINMPSLNINGMQSGNVGKMASNVIPTSATAVLDLRLVLGNDWQRQQKKVIDHIRRQGYWVIDREPTDEERSRHPKICKVLPGGDGYNAQRTSMELPMAKKVVEAVKNTTKDQVVLMPTLGGSLPLFLFEKYLNAKTITVPIANHDNNQHAENENIRIQNLWDGIETMAAIMMIDK